jgi:eukaryotic-like serine/threonine-protein kinase
VRCQRTWEDDFLHCPYDGQRLEEETLSVLPPEVLFAARYEILRMLGEGGTARVFKALDTHTGRHVAVKVALGVIARTPPWPERMMREVELLGSIDHPNVIRVLGGGQQTDGSPFMVMEYLEGETLGTLLRTNNPIPIETTLSVITDVARGLSAAHAVGAIHRDIKPDNIFLVPNADGTPRAKVFDFGMARLAGGSGLTAKGFILGTPEYMAPEQTVNDRAGPRSDVYALGVVMYRMLTGSLPFEGDQVELLAQHLFARPAHPSSRRAGISRELDAVTLSAMRKLARNRYPQMSDFVEDLERVAGKRAGEITADYVAFDDAYEPQSAFSKQVAGVLKKKLPA